MKTYLFTILALLCTGLLTAQNVGINTTTPTATLDVNGTLRVGNLGSATTQMVVSSPDGNLSVQAIPTQVTYTAGGGISIAGNAIANTAPDQVVNLSGTGATTITGAYPNFTITSTDLVNDADADPANELQTLSLSGNTLDLTNGGSIDLTPILPTQLWFQNSGNAFRSSGFVGVGTSFPNSTLHVNASGTDDAFRVQVSGSSKLIVDNNGGTTLGTNATPPTNGLYVSGNTGLGTSAPTERLHVNGNIRVANDADLFGLDQLIGFNDLRFAGDATGGDDFIISASGTAGFGTVFGNVALNVRNISGNAGGQVLNVELNDGTNVFQVQADQDVFVIGDFFVNSGTKNFILDHPLDPANKSLAHNAVEGPGHITYYSGSVRLDASGSATVALPDYFDALNTNCHYQLTCVGGFAQVYIAEEVANNQFRIAGGTPNLKVSWQISAERNDPWAKNHPYEAEIDKTGEESGKYWYPEGYGQPASQRIGFEKAEEE